ncbi:hypothetical protein ARSEF1564_007999 [Beauveria bassiana]
MGGVVSEEPIYVNMGPSGGAAVSHDVPSAGSTNDGVGRCYSAAPDHMDTVPVGATGMMQLGCYGFAIQQDGYEGNAMQVTQDYTTKRNTLIHKGPTRQHSSPSPGFKRDGDVEDVQHSPSPSPVTSVSARPRPQQRGHVKPPQQTKPHKRASRKAIRIPHGEDSYQSRPIITKSRAELENECKSTTQMVELIVKELGLEMHERFNALHYEMVDRFNALHDEMVHQDQDDN